MKMNKKGVSIIGTIFTMIILGVMGASLVALVSTDQESRMKSIFRERAFYAMQAGLEYALREIKEGGYPIVTNKVISNANFTTAIEQNERKITVTGMQEAVKKTYSITTDLLAKDCTTINVAGASVGGAGNNQVQGISLTRNCLNAVNIDKVTVQLTPNLSERLKYVRISGTEVYDDLSGVASGEPADIVDSRMTGSSTIDVLRFSSGVAGKKVIVTLTFTDSSTLASQQMQF